MASDILAPSKTLTFTVKTEPRRDAERKTIRRLMRMQRHIQRGLEKLSRQRRQKDNETTIRAGVEWVNRARATKLTRVEVGGSFTITVTPQIIPDIRSVEKYLDIAAA